MRYICDTLASLVGCFYIILKNFTMYTTSTLKKGIKMSAVLPFLKIIAQQQGLDLTKLSDYKKANIFLIKSINKN